LKNRTIQGAAVSPGLAVGPVHVVHTGPANVPTWNVAREEVALEIGRLAAALNSASDVLAERQRLVASSASDKDAEIFAVHRMILQDPSALRQVEGAIAEQRINAEAAVQQLINRFEETMSRLDENSIRGYAADVSDPWRLVLDRLLHRDRQSILEAEERVVLAAAELTPQVVSFLERERILAVIAEKGGRFSHGAVLARSLGIPCVVNLTNLLARLEQNLVVAVDGDHGEIQLRPTKEQVEQFLERRRSMESRRQAVQDEAAQPAQTPDGVPMGVLANIESVRDLETFPVSHVDGVGLLRTEFLYMERQEFPSEDEQYRLYRRVLEHMSDKPATLRLLDIGGDKPLPYFHTPPERNPALGWRGIRITLQWSDLMRVQMRAMLRASVSGRLQILLPMVSSIEEVRRVHGIFDEVRSDLLRQGYETAEDVPVGAMIEVPSALLELERIVQEVDFVSVGTNDLVQYLLAVDRDSAWVANLYEPHHPAVMRALFRIASIAREAGRSASVCGDLAGDPTTAVLLLGMGFSSVSTAPQFGPEIKYAVRRVSADEARSFAQEVLAEDTSAGVRALLEGLRERLYPRRGGLQKGLGRA